MKQSTKGLLMVIISGLVFGTVPFLVKTAYAEGARPEIFVFFRYASLSLVLLPFALRKREVFGAFAKHFWIFLLLAALSITTPLLLYLDYQFTSTSIATTIHFLYPALVAVISVVFLREKLSPKRLISVILCGVGIVLMMELGGQITLPGVLIAAASAVTWAVYIVVLSKLKAPEMGTEHILFFIAILSFSMITAIVLLDGAFFTCVREMTPLGWILSAALGLVTSVFGIAFFAFGVRKTDAQLAAIASTLEPIVCILIGVIFLQESFSVRTAIGAAMILTAVVLLAWPKKEGK